MLREYYDRSIKINHLLERKQLKKKLNNKAAASRYKKNQDRDS